jgi:hypothetical protein
MTLTTSTLRPGLLVSVKTSCRGNVRYDKRDLDARHYIENGAEIAKWETTRTIEDAAEFEAAKKAQSKARAIIGSVCSASAFGYLCREDKINELETAIANAQIVVDRFNATARLTRVNVYVIAGKVASDDEAAVRAINSEVRDLLDKLAEGISKSDVKTIRDAADKAKSIGKVLSPSAQQDVEFAITVARNAAKQIVKAGEAAAVEIDTLAIRAITEARTSFLDLRDEVEIANPDAPRRALDFDPAEFGVDLGATAKEGE